jgi:DNA invertase Pin-like site-specific DNA recombinase
MKIGYARVSTSDQKLDLQIDALELAGCEKIFIDDGVSGAKRDRPQLNAALEFARDGDTLVVWKLDRLGRSIQHLIEEVNGLEARGVGFVCLEQAIDTTTPGGKLVFHIFAAMAEFERDLIRERTNAGLAAARARGRNGGRPSALKPEQVAMGRALAKEGSMSITAICEQLGCSRSTYYRQIATVA